MHDLAFADSARPAQCVILKLPVLRYSIGHEVILLNQRNPLVMEGFDSLDGNTQRAAIIRAADICSQTWVENNVIHSGWNKWMAKRIWGKWERVIMTMTESEWALSIADFRNYRLAGSTYPPVPDAEANRMANGDDDKGRELGGPFLARLYNFVCTIPNVGEPFDFPFGLATFLYFSHLESEGEMKIENSAEKQIREEMKAHREAIAKEKKEAV